MKCRLSITAAMLLSGSLQAAEWRLAAGGLATRWKTSEGQVGHTANCRTRECEDRDFRIGNLDSSIGLRLSGETYLARSGALTLLGGTDLTLISTEYNLSQRDINIVSVGGFLGGELEYGRVSGEFRLGAGPTLTDDGRLNGSVFWETTGSLRFNADNAMRFGVRNTFVGEARMRDFSLLFSTTLHQEAPHSRLDYAVSSGLSHPGIGGKDLLLGHAFLQRHSVHYQLGTGSGDRLGLVWTAAAHESQVRTVFLGTPGNKRGKTIPSLGLSWDRAAAARRFQWRYGVGIEVADWRDDHSLLMKDRLTVMEGRVDAAIVGSVGIQRRLFAGIWFLACLEQAYWTSLGIGESRLLVGAGVKL